MAVDMIPFEEYSFAIVPVNNNDLRVSRIRLIPVNGSDSIEYITTDTDLLVTPQQGSLKIIREEIVLIDGDSRVVIPEAVLDEIVDFNFLSYDFRTPITLEVHEVRVDGSETDITHNVVFSVMNHNNTEKIPTRLKIDKIKWSAVPSESQRVSISIDHYAIVSEPEEEIERDWVNIFSETDFDVAVDGTLSEPIILSSLVEDDKYRINVYHYDLDEQKVFYFYAPKKPICGENPIVDKIEWEGRKIYLDAIGLLPTVEGALIEADWGFPMDYQTKGINLRSSIISSDPDAYVFKCLKDSNNRCLPCICSYPSRSYYFPVGQDLDNKFAEDILMPTAVADSFRMIGINFLINSMEVNQTCNILRYKDSNNTEQYIGIKRTSEGYFFHIGGTDYAWGTISQANILNTWQTFLLFMTNSNGNNAAKFLIPNLTNTFNNGIKKGDTLIFTPSNNASRYPVDKNGFTVTINYNCPQTIDCVKAFLIVNIYQYEDSTFIAETDEIELTLSGGPGTIIETLANGFGYYVTFGFKLIVQDNLDTESLTINSILIDSNTISLISSEYDSVYSNADLSNYLTFTWSGANILAASIVSDLINGYSAKLLSPNTLVAKTSEIAYFGDGGGNFALSHFSCCDVVVDSSFDIDSVDQDLYNLVSQNLIKMLIEGYKATPTLKCTNTNNDTHIITGDFIEELKGDRATFFLDGINANLLSQVPSDTITLDLSSYDINTEETILMAHTSRIFKNIKALARVPYDIDFDTDFDTAVATFKQHYYAKQKRWGGNMGGGVNAELIYFDRGRKCLILEQHGDLYSGSVAAITGAGAIGYGFPVSLNENPESWPDNKRFSQRNIRVAGLIQSINYHGYGMFDCWFKVPKGMAGLAICLWYFHYQEIYDYDRTFDFWVNTGVDHADGNNYRYDQSVDQGFGAVWLVVNNEIDMELGSENTPYRSDVNPNNNANLKWYAAGLSMRQSIGVTTEGTDYGLWMIDWERSKDLITDVIQTYGIDPTDSNCWIASNRLVWVKVKNSFDEVNSGATTRSCRFNNWLNERWNDGCGSDNLAQSGIYNRSEMDVNNRTPLGELQHDSLGNLLGLIEHYYDDGEYHKWSIDWQPTRTRLLIDDEEIAICDAFVPFNPMTMLVGCWFPSANIYDAGPLNGNYGTWAGVHANFDIANMEVKRIKYTPYTEQQAPTGNMRYDCETYAQDGLRELNY